VAVTATYIAFNNGGGFASDVVSAYNDTADGLATISGFVTDRLMNGIPGATVELWEMRYDSATGQYVNSGRVVMNGNLQTTNSDGTFDAIGTYQFPDVPQGVYNVTAEVIDSSGVSHQWFRIANASQPGSTIVNIAIPDYITGGLAAAADAGMSYLPGNGSTDVTTPDSRNASAADRDWSMVAGMITDKNKNGAPGARVTLWEGQVNGMGWFVNDRVAGIERTTRRSPTLTVTETLWAATGSTGFRSGSIT
jgi:protocatechuate 3,4-dioxygenase beta subunit